MHCLIFILLFPFSSIPSHTSSGKIPSKRPIVSVPHHFPDPAKTSQQYRRTTDSKDVDRKETKSSSSIKEITIVNGHIKHERTVKRSRDTAGHVEVHQDIFNPLALASAHARHIMQVGIQLEERMRHVFSFFHKRNIVRLDSTDPHFVIY